jgi:hypothetical protein
VQRIQETDHSQTYGHIEEQERYLIAKIESQLSSTEQMIEGLSKQQPLRADKIRVLELQVQQASERDHQREQENQEAGRRREAEEQQNRLSEVLFTKMELLLSSTEVTIHGMI